MEHSSGSTNFRGGGHETWNINHRERRPSFYDYFSQVEGGGIVGMNPLPPPPPPDPLVDHDAVFGRLMASFFLVLHSLAYFTNGLGEKLIVFVNRTRLLGVRSLHHWLVYMTVMYYLLSAKCRSIKTLSFFFFFVYLRQKVEEGSRPRYLGLDVYSILIWTLSIHLNGGNQKLCQEKDQLLSNAIIHTICKLLE